MEKNTQPLGTSPAPTLQPAAPMPSANQVMPSKNSHTLGIILVSVAMLFVVCAMLWFIFGGSVKSRPAMLAVSPTPPSSAPSVYPANAPPRPTAAEFVSISNALRSGNSFQFAGVTGLNPKTIPELTLSGFATMKSIVFDEKSFQVTPDGQKATVQATITLETGIKLNTTFSFIAQGGKWNIEVGN
jgi:hypothetical protein